MHISLFDACVSCRSESLLVLSSSYLHAMHDGLQYTHNMGLCHCKKCNASFECKSKSCNRMPKNNMLIVTVLKLNNLELLSPSIWANKQLTELHTSTYHGLCWPHFQYPERIEKMADLVGASGEVFGGRIRNWSVSKLHVVRSRDNEVNFYYINANRRHTPWQQQ